MKNIITFFKAWWPALVWTLLGVALLWPALTSLYDVLPAPDDAPYFIPRAFALNVEAARVTGASFTPLSFLPAIMPPLYAHDFAYFLTPLLMMLAAAWWFTGRGADRLPALVAGGALGFAGYSFTIVAAGHRGFFDMTVYLLLLLGALSRALNPVSSSPVHRPKSLFYFALAGAAAGWTFTAQPDFGAVALGVAALYAIWILAIGAWRNITPLPFAGGIALAIAFFVLATAGSIQNVFTNVIQYRKSQITQSAPKAAGEATADDPQVQWDFATGWSLPPEESLELLAPNYKGTSSWDKATPYWGRLGRSHDWKPNTNERPNFRGHTVYIGLAPFLLGLFALGAYVSRRKDKDDVLRDVPFWAALGIIALLLAFGRYAPLYQFFYKLPQMSLLRAPVKFIRVLEWSTAFCFAAGLTALLRNPPSKQAAKNLWIALGVFIIAFLAFAHNLPKEWAAQISIAGHFQNKSELLQNAARALWHPVWAATVLAGFLALLHFKKTQWALALLVVFLALDLRRANAPYITTQDLRTHYAPSPAFAHFAKELPNDPLLCHADFFLGTRGASHITHPLRRMGVGNTTPAPSSEPNTPHIRLMQAIFDKPATNPFLRYAQLTAARFLWVDAQSAQQLARAPGVEAVQTFEFNGAVLRPSDKPNVVLFRMKNALPAAWISTRWIFAETLDEQLASVTAPNYNPLAAPVATAPASTNAANAAEILSRELAIYPARGKVSYRATGGPALLTIRFGTNAKLVATLEDGTRLPTFTTSLFWMGIVVPEGEHTVTLRRDYAKAPFFYAGLAPMLLLLVWGCVFVWRSKPRKN